MANCFILVGLLTIIISFFGTHATETNEFKGLYLNLFDGDLQIAVDEAGIKQKLIEIMNKTAPSFCENEKSVDINDTADKVMSRLKTVHEKATICEIIKNKFVWVMQPWIDSFEKCSETFKTGPTFIIDQEVSAINAVCKMEGELLMEFTNPCLFKVDVQSCVPTKEKFLDDFVKAKASNKDHNIKKSVCSLYEASRGCIEKEINNKCKIEKSRLAYMTLLDAVFKTPC